MGNTIFPLLELNPEAYVYACDFSETAISLLRERGTVWARQLCAFLADITANEISSTVPAGSVDLCTMFFVLSALSPDTFSKVCHWSPLLFLPEPPP